MFSEGIPLASIDRLWDEIRNHHVNQTRNLQGRLLTQLEASMTEGRQLEALKEIVSIILWETDEYDKRIASGLFREYVQASKISSEVFSKPE